MRDILFRGKNGCRWVEGSLFCNYPCFENGVADESVKFLYIVDGKQKTLDRIQVNPETVGQFTGLTDKNGTKIFEGDLLRFPAKNKYEETTFEAYEVFYHDNDCADRHIGWQFNRLHFLGNLSGKDIGLTTFLPKYTKQMEVIGNIHDNPELLGGD